MAVSPVWRRVARHFSISAPRMAVRTHLSWPWRALIVLALAAVIGGMWWWGFDFGQLLGGFNKREIEQRLATLQADATTAQQEAASLRSRNTQLESEIAMMRGLQGTLARQLNDLQHENAAMKEEVAFLQTFFEGGSKPGLAVQRLAVDASNGEVARYSVLVVRGGNPKGDFEGRVVLDADVVPAAGAGEAGQGHTITVPPQETPGPGPLSLRFKYYQRLEGTFRIPPGHAVRAVTARAYEAGSDVPRAVRTLTMP
ncbi:MAG: hypothetical protein KJ018_04470 [Burkholderiales bacterium]|nr:hypothetical protein [Burkholderiales bacterium]GIK87306.1 MAG: hypothetical protein BroJett026_27870 [Betaproteobacteria bacterium]